MLKNTLSEDIVQKILELYKFEMEIHQFNLNINNRFFLHIFELKNEKKKEKYFNSKNDDILNFKLKISNFVLAQSVRWPCYKGKKNIVEIYNPLYYLFNKEEETLIYTVITSLNTYGINQFIIDKLGKMILSFKNVREFTEIKIIFNELQFYNKDILYEDFKNQLDYLVQNNILILDIV